jgi:hypothetical protein
MRFSVDSSSGRPERRRPECAQARRTQASGLLLAVLLAAACATARAPSSPFPEPLPAGRWPFRTAVWEAHYALPDGASLADRVWFSVEQGVREQTAQDGRPPTNFLRVGPYAYQWSEGQRIGVRGPAGLKPLGSVPDMREILSALPFDLDRSHVTIGAITEVGGARCREVAFRYETRNILVPRGKLLRQGTVWLRLDRPFPMKILMASPVSYGMVIDHVVFDQPIAPEKFEPPPEVHFRFFTTR